MIDLRVKDGSSRPAEPSGLAGGVRSLAFYLPQYHQIPENDEWWGVGFTEWRNVVRAKPLFKGHYQPHLPADLGFYDLRVPETREAQADLARTYGITGFCYYHYWFNGRLLLNRPFDEVLSTGRPEFPFCLCWANENWTRRWDGREQDVLLGQQYSLEDDLAHIEHLLPAFADDRYVKVDGRPLFLVYRSGNLPDPVQTTDVWRDACRRAGFPDLYLVKVEGYGPEVNPTSTGFNAAVEFAPDWNWLPPAIRRRDTWDATARFYNQLQKVGLVSSAYLRNWIYSYAELSERMRLKPPVPYRRFRCATPGWDNSPRRQRDAIIFNGSSPELYEEWLKALVLDTLADRQGDERIVFVNAWNEWAEGNHLEPDRRWGRAYLEATSRALQVETPSHHS
jgi:lipopolysaccharide biosynthesis protein